MELRQYWHIIRQRIWIPVVLLLVVGGVSLGWQLARPAAPTYGSTMRFIVGVKPEALPGEYTYDGYYAWLSSEYLVDDFTGVIGSQGFAAGVNARLAAAGSGLRLPPGVLGGVAIAGQQHRIVRVNVNWNNPQELAQLAQAVASTMEQDGPALFEQFFSQIAAGGVVITTIDPPSPPAPNPPGLTQRLEVPVRLILALLAGVALAFFLNYLDTSVRDRAELEQLGIPVLAEIPKK